MTTPLMGFLRTALSVDSIASPCLAQPIVLRTPPRSRLLINCAPVETLGERLCNVPASAARLEARGGRIINSGKHDVRRMRQS
jgi:hypothetical protein